MKIQLRSDSNEMLELSEFSRYENELGYSADITVSCKQFLCVVYALIDKDSLNSFINQVNEIILTSKGLARLNSFGEEWFIEFTSKPSGLIVICGHLKPQLNWLDFTFSINSALLPSFIKDLNAWQTMKVT